MVSVEKHFDEIDIYKGIAILLIILGHSFCEFPVDFTKTELISVQSMVGVFNLNMFFVTSGVLFSLKESWRVFFVKKTNRLMIPWISFVIVALLLRNVFSAFTHGQPGDVFHELLLDIICGKSYWFLYALMLMMIVTKAIKNRTALAILGGALLIAQYFLKGFQPEYNILCFTRFLMFFPWFVFGFLLKEGYPYLSEKVSRWNFYILLAVTLILFSILIMAILLGLNKMFVIQSILLPVVGCMAFWFLSMSFVRVIRLKFFFTHFGKYSLQYYLNHLLIMLVCYYVGARVFDTTHMGALGIIFTSACVISWLMLLIEKRLPLVCKLCGIV